MEGILSRNNIVELDEPKNLVAQKKCVFDLPVRTANTRSQKIILFRKRILLLRHPLFQKINNFFKRPRHFLHG